MRTSRVTLVVLLALCLGSASCSLTGAALDPSAAKIGGPLTVNGPLVVHGSVTVGGPCVVHGPVHAAALTVGGPMYTLPNGEQPGPAGEAFASSVYIGGPLTVNGPLIADGKLTVGGPFTSEMSQNLAGQDMRIAPPLSAQQNFVFRPPAAPGSALETPPQLQQAQPPLQNPSEVTE